MKCFWPGTLLPVLGTLSQRVLSGDLVAALWVHWRDFRLSKTVNESTGKQCLEHCSGIFHISQKQWLSHKAVLDSDPGQWPGHHCGQCQHWQQCLRRLEQCQAVLKHCMPVLVTAKHCSGPMPAVVRSYAGSAWALLRHRNQVYKCRED